MGSEMCIRDRAADMLRAKGLTVDVRVYDWGTVGTFIDPDGNACELKNADDPFFADPS